MSLDLKRNPPAVICDYCSNWAETWAQNMDEAVAQWKLNGWEISRRNKVHKCPKCAGGWTVQRSTAWVI